MTDDGPQTTDDSATNPHSALYTPHSEDPFDRLYSTWAATAIQKRQDPPSRERWDAIVLRLILSEDPDRIKRYRWLESTLPDGLGADAYELWTKTPDYTPNLSVSIKTLPDLTSYAQSQQGSMQRLMQAQGLGERYTALVAEYEQYIIERKARIKHGQTRVLVMGCAGMGFILVMILSVLLIILLKLHP